MKHLFRKKKQQNPTVIAKRNGKIKRLNHQNKLLNMRDLVLLTSLIFLLFSCQNEENIEEKNIEKPKIDKTEVITIEDLPEGEWNGEYIKIVDEAELKPRKKSLGSDFFSMGKLKIDMEEDVIEFDLFERKKNILTFTNASITAFIRSAFNEDVHLYFKKNNIVAHHKGKYKVD